MRSVVSEMNQSTLCRDFAPLCDATYMEPNPRWAGTFPWIRSLVIEDLEVSGK